MGAGLVLGCHQLWGIVSCFGKPRVYFDSLELPQNDGACGGLVGESSFGFMIYI